MDRAGKRKTRSLCPGVAEGWIVDLVEAGVGRGEYKERAIVL